jgi:hypothetical protein
MPNNTYFGHLEPVLTGISQETKQNNFVEEQVFLLEDFLLFGLEIKWVQILFLQVVNPNLNPQVWRTSLGYDHKFDSNYIVTVDASFNKDLNGVQVQNWGLKNQQAN